MHPAQMAYPAPPYSNAPHGYQHPQMGMMGACNPYCMSMQPNNVDGNLPANGDLPDAEISANQDATNDSYPPPFPPTQKIIKTAFCRIICKFHTLTYLCKIDLI